MESYKEILKYCGADEELNLQDKSEYDTEYGKKDPKEKCLINDAIHGPVMLTPLLYQIINTPEFHRLRNIKQLGAANYVYPGANHTRLDHSIGVCYLAGEFARSLKEKIEDVRKTAPDKEKDWWSFDDKEVICAQVAGLCHDLGHGPFSHMFEHMVVNELFDPEEKEKPNIKRLLNEKGDLKLKHEELSVVIFKRLLVKNPKVLAQFVKAGLGVKEVTLIELMIHPKWEVKGLKEKEKTREFLYEIIANKLTGIDVDKWDYYARDCHYLGITHDFQWKRCMLLGRVVKTKEGTLRIAFRDKEMDNLCGMFRIRGNLHQKAYQHKTSKAVERMISDVMINAKTFKVIGVSTSTERLTLQDAVINALECVKFKPKPELLEGYLALTDCILSTIGGHAAIKTQESDSETQESDATQKSETTLKSEINTLIKRIEKRDLYYLSARVRVDKPSTESSDSHKRMWEILDKMLSAELKQRIHERLLQDIKTKIKLDELWTEIVPIRLASEIIENPVSEVLFYKKPDGEQNIEVLSKEEAQKLASSLTVPKAFVEYEVRVYDKRPGKDRNEDKTWEYKKIQKAMDDWISSLGKETGDV